MNSPIPSIQKVQEELEKLSLEKSFSQAQRVMFSVIALLDPTVADKDPESVFQLFTDSDGKIRANAGWFFEDKMIADRKAVYKIHGENALGIDFKAYGVSKASKRIVSWATGVTPNFEDEAFNGKFNVGIDFVVPKSCDRVIVVLTNNYVVRTLELKGKLTATYQEILAKWAVIKDFSNKKAFHSILWESFDLQPLNKKFYAGISERFILLRQHLEKEGIFDQKHASYFSNRLMGRVIFCWFLDHKNVLNSKKKYFDAKAYSSSMDYYRGRLETLFYRVLNTPIGDREPLVQDDVTPFLNGGLFEPRATDLFENPKLTFPKNYFDDLFEFLSGYNFTTDESTSQFQQVAIDPEMLGRIFENLLAEMTEETGEQARKAKGAFYTPREIVDYMCRESLREYLKTKLSEDEFRDKRLEQLIDRPDKEFQDQDHNWRRDWKPYKDSIIKALDELTVLDPACGSGAFPIGMLQLLVQVYERLESRFDSYRTKLQIIEKNLYGVDIEPMAVEIARLRAWLSIIVDEDADSKKIKPLPNLEFKFICANSLIDLDQNSETPLGGKDHNALAEELRTIRDAYFNTESLNKKKSLREKYNKLINEQEGLFGESKRSKQLKTYRPFDNEWSAGFFNPEFMFGVEKFDVVIGNPPYGASLKGKYREEVLKNFGRVPDFEIYYYFIEFAKKILRGHGTNSYIVPNTFLFNVFAFEYRKSILNNWKIKDLVDCTAFKIFESATVHNVVFVFQKSTELNDSIGYKQTFGARTFSELVGKKTVEITKDSLLLNNKNWGLAFKLSEDVLNVILKIKSAPSRIGDIFPDLSQGLIAYDKYKGQSEEVINSRAFHHKENTSGKFKKWLWGGDINPYEVKWNGKEYIDYSIGIANPRKPKYFNGERILVREITNPKIYAGFTNEELYHDPAIIVILGNSKNILPLLAILNSKLATFYHFNSSPKATKGSFPKILVKDIKEFPLPKWEDVQVLSSMVEKILATKSSSLDVDTKTVYKEIDQTIYQLYGLSDEEIKIVENN